MNVEIGPEATQFSEKEDINGIFVEVFVASCLKLCMKMFLFFSLYTVQKLYIYDIFGTVQGISYFFWALYGKFFILACPSCQLSKLWLA